MSPKMRKAVSQPGLRIDAGMTVLDIVSRFEETAGVFKKYDEQAGECICCEALFESLRTVAAKYGLDLKKLVDELEAAARIR